jgi:hypothetical protein
MSKKERQLRKAAKTKEAKDENGIIRNDIFLNFKIDQKFHLNDNHKAFVEKAMDDSSQILFCDLRHTWQYMLLCLC